MTEKTPARKIAEKIEREGRFGPDAPDDYDSTVEKLGDKVGPAVYGAANAVRAVSKIPRTLTVRKARSNEEMNELTREVARGMKKGGVVSASKRADGIAQRGKTRGKVR